MQAFEIEADIPHAILVILPVIFSKAAPSDELERFLNSWSLRVDPRLRKQYPQENWTELYSSTYKACKLALKSDDTLPIPQEIGTSSRESDLHTMLERPKKRFKSSKS